MQCGEAKFNNTQLRGENLMKRNFHAGRQLGSGLSLNILTDDELQEIHYGTLEVLNETGVFVDDEAALDCFAEGGAIVDRDTKIVRIPPHVVEDAIRVCTSKGRSLRPRPKA